MFLLVSLLNQRLNKRETKQICFKLIEISFGMMSRCLCLCLDSITSDIYSYVVPFFVTMIDGFALICHSFFTLESYRGLEI